MVQELYPCHKKQRKSTRIQNIFKWSRRKKKNTCSQINPKRHLPFITCTTVNADPDQPLVLMMAPTGTAAFQIGGSTIDSALLTYDSYKKQTYLGNENNHATKT